MIVYGDHDDVVDTARRLAELTRADALAGLSGLAWHQACFGVFLGVAGLLQGWADHEAAETGFDEVSPAQAILMDVLVGIAGALDLSWSSRFAHQAAPDLSALGTLRGAAPARLSVRRCEGYAHYALYPELTLQAARRLPAGAVVIGLRSIGTGLAALAAAASKARAAVTLRPRGAPFSRHVAVGPGLEATILRDPHAAIVLVDEGPGLSGSSFGGTADWLEARGVDPARIVFMPSHDNGPGPRASAAHRRRWMARPRLVAAFEDVLLDPSAAVPLARWFEDLTGPAAGPLVDLSGGAWRALSADPAAPADPQREARKYRLATEKGDVLLKFAGHGEAAGGKLERARRLHRAGFGLEPLGLRYGFLAERWAAGTTRPGRDAIVARLPAYLAFRGSAFPAVEAGASLEDLAGMARYNIGQAAGEAAAVLLDPWTNDRLQDLQRSVRPVHVDARLHRWEWLQTPDGLRKTDAVDHSEAHDLIGCQDIGWDVAGAVVEFDLETNESERLIAEAMPGRAEAPSLAAFLTLGYLGFQIGWWTLAAEAPGRDTQLRRYFARVEALLKPSGTG